MICAILSLSNSIVSFRSRIHTSSWAPVPFGLWPVHGLFWFVLSWFLLSFPQATRFFRSSYVSTCRSGFPVPLKSPGLLLLIVEGDKLRYKSRGGKVGDDRGCC